jgi:hypothetical protein
MTENDAHVICQTNSGGKTPEDSDGAIIFSNKFKFAVEL